MRCCAAAMWPACCLTLGGCRFLRRWCWESRLRCLGCGFERDARAPSSVDGSDSGNKSDFVRAANRLRGGKAFIVLPSTAKNDSISRIVPVLSPVTHVSTSKNDINYVVTAYGVAQLRGKPAGQRARDLFGIAHPDFGRS